MIHLSRIALVEDEEDIRLSVQDYLSHLGHKVWGAGSAEEFYRRFVAEPVDVVVLDIGLPGEDGLAVTELLQSNPGVAVIILSARDALEERLSGLRAGADRYLVKPVNLEELAANVQALARRQEPAPAPTPGSAPAKPWVLSRPCWRLTAPSGRSMMLTAREFALLDPLVEQEGQVLSKKVLGELVFGTRVTNAPDRLNVLVTRLRKKAAAELDEPLPIRTAHQLGYAFTAQACRL